MFFGYVVVFIAGGTLGFVIACALAADKNIRNGGKSSRTEINRYIKYN